METIISETNLKVIKEITNEELEKDNIDDNRRFLPKEKAIVTLCIFAFGVTSLQFNDNKKESTVYLNGKNSIRTEVMNIETIDNSGYNIDSEVSESFKNDDGVAKMNEVTHKDLNELERFLNEKLDSKFEEIDRKMDSKLDSVETNVNNIKDSISEMSNSITEIRKDVQNIPDKIIAERYKFWTALIIAPIITGIVLFILGKII